MKVTASDLLAILRRFGVGDDDHVPRHIDQIKHDHPSPINQLVAFRFERKQYYALFDETAHDNSSYIIEEIRKFNSNVLGELLKNPTSDMSTYGLPFKGKDVYLFRVETGNKRLDLLLADQYPDISRNTWQKYIKAGYVSVNGHPTTTAKHEVSDADQITVSIPQGTDFSEYELPITYVDDSVVVINKPAGILTHSKGAMNDEFTVADFFRRYTTVGLETNRPGIVHRLDRDTSGIMIGARTPEAFRLLTSQFADRKAKKTYFALVKGSPEQASATIDIPIGRNPQAPSTFRADSKGKSAQTDYEVVHSDGIHSLIKLQPKTGRTHQLRVHLSHIGLPILGDRVYGTPDKRLFLHAYSLEITTGYELRQTFTAPLPPEFRQILKDIPLDDVL